MARVEIASMPWGVVQDRSGNAVLGASVTLKNLDGSPATHWSAATGGTSTTAAIASDINGTLTGRFIEGGQYLWSCPSVSVTDRRVDAVSGSVESGTVIYAVGHGVVGDNSTDNTTAINAAITAAVAIWSIFGTGTAKVVLPPGVIKTTGGHTDGGGCVIIEGAGESATTLYCPSATSSTDIITLNVSGSKVRNLTIGGSAGFGGRDGIVLNAAYTKVENVEIGNLAGNGITVGKAAGAIVHQLEKIKIRQCKGYGIQTVAASGSTDGLWSNIDIGQCGKSGVKLDNGSQNLVNVHSWGNGVEDGLGQSDGHGFYLNSSTNHLSNCQAESNNGRGVYFHGSGNRWTGGSIWANYIVGAYFLSANRSSLDGADIYNNGVFNTAGSTSNSAAAVHLDGAVACAVTNNNIWDDGTAVSAGSYGSYTPTFAFPGRSAVLTHSRAIVENNSGDYNTITGNTMRSQDTRSGTVHTLVGANTVFRNNVGSFAPATVASAATVAIPPDGYPITKVSGTTGITAVTMRFRETVTLMFSGSLTVTNSAGLHLSGGVNFSAVAGSTLTLASDGSNIYEVARSV